MSGDVPLASEPVIRPEKCWSEDGSDFSHETLGDLLDCYEFEPGRIVYVGVPVRPGPTEFLPDSGDILDWMGERAYEEHHEHAEDWPDIAAHNGKAPP